MGYQRLSVYLADREADLLTCAYRVGLGVRRHQPGDTCSLSGTGCGQVVSGRRCYIVDDLLEPAAPGCPELADGSGFRSAIIMPVSHAGKVIAPLCLENWRPKTYGPFEERILQRAAALLASPVANSMLYTQLTRKSQELSLIRSLPEVVGVLTGSPGAFQRFADQLRRLVAFDRLAIYIRDDEEQWVTWSLAEGTEDIQKEPLSHRLVSSQDLHHRWLHRVAKSARSVICHDLSKRRRSPCLDHLLRLGLKSSIHVPLRTSEGSIGVLALHRSQRRAYTTAHRRLLETLASHLASELQHSRLHQQARKQPGEMAVANEVARILASTPELDEVFQQFASKMNELVSLDLASLSWIDPNGSDIHTVQAGVPSLELTRGQSFGTRLPLLFRQQVIGALTLWRRLPGPFTSQEQEMLDHLGTLIAPAVQNAHLYHQARRQA